MSDANIKTRSPFTGVGRPAVLQLRILDDLRRQIVRGKLAPGRRLPTRRELCESFDASTQTVQAALDTLTREGFVEARGTHGTFVVDNPPHLSHFAVVFSGDPQSVQAPRFWQTMSDEVDRLREVDGTKIRAITKIDGHRDNEDFHLLSRDVAEHRLAGLVFIGPPWELEGSSIVEEPRMPRVIIGGRSRSYPEIPSVVLDSTSFFHRAIDHLAQRGCKRLGVICHATMSPDHGKEVVDWNRDILPRVAARGLRIEPYWIQCASQTYPETAKRVAHLMLSGSSANRPDALLIADDKFVDHAVLGVMAAGLRSPGDIEIVAHCNFPWPSSTGLPMRRLGFNSRDVLRKALEILEQSRRSRRRPEDVHIEACFEDELEN